MPQIWLIKPHLHLILYHCLTAILAVYLFPLSTISLLEKPTACFACCAMFISAVLGDARKETPSRIALLWWRLACPSLDRPVSVSQTSEMAFLVFSWDSTVCFDSVIISNLPIRVAALRAEALVFNSAVTQFTACSQLAWLDPLRNSLVTPAKQWHTPFKQSS